MSSSPLSPIEAIIADIKAGKMVVMVDDESRENEGDLVLAAQFASAKAINFMSKFGRGLICLTLTQKRCAELKLEVVKSQDGNRSSTNFTNSIDSATGVSTGISAQDRAHTIQTAINPLKNERDIIQPGHIFPLMAADGGVLTRPGHTEAGCDLAKLAGLNESAVIVEIMNEDGTMARIDDLRQFAKKHQLKIGSIADLIQYRIQNDKTIKRVESSVFNQQKHPNFRIQAYEDSVYHHLHFAYVKGDLRPDKPTIVRVQVQDSLKKALHALNQEKDLCIADYLDALKNHPQVVVVWLRTEKEQSLKSKLGLDKAKSLHDDERTYGIGAQILSDLRVGKMQVIGSERPFKALSGFDLTIEKHLHFDEAKLMKIV